MAPSPVPAATAAAAVSGLLGLLVVLDALVAKEEDPSLTNEQALAVGRQRTDAWLDGAD